MISPFRKLNKTITSMDEFFSIISESSNLFQEGIESYLKEEITIFHKNLSLIRLKEKKADELLKDIEQALYKYSLLPELRFNVMRLIQRVDDIQDNMKEVLVQFDVERPYIPNELHFCFNELTQSCMKAVKNAICAANSFFTTSSDTKKFIELIVDFEHIADSQAESLKRKVFHEVENLSLPQKFHLRYFALHIEDVSDIAKSIGYTLNLMLIKRFN